MPYHQEEVDYHRRRRQRPVAKTSEHHEEKFRITLRMAVRIAMGNDLTMLEALRRPMLIANSVPHAIRN